MDLVDLLNVELQKRCEANPSYSHRAFARDLDVDPGTLSHVIKRKRAPNPTLREKIYTELKLSVEQRKILDSAPTEPFQFGQMEMDVFLSLSDWYYDAIVELMRTKGFESQAQFVSERLGIEVEEAETAIKRLMHLKIIKRMPNKKWVVKPDNTLVYGGDQTAFALQKLQGQLLEKAMQALKEVPKKKCEQASMVMAINKRDLPEAKKRIKGFQQDLCKYLQRPNRESDEVYQLITMLFPLTQQEQEQDQD